jgi:hypothetical protein
MAGMNAVRSADKARPWDLPPVEAYEAEHGRANGHAKPDVAPVVLRPVHEIVAENREPEWLIHKIIERNVLAVIAGPRGTFKSFIALHWSMLMALDGHAGVILSGEGAGLDRRIAAWMAEHRESVDLAALPLVALERPLNLTAEAELAALCQAMRALPQPAAFVVIDTLSKFSTGLDENDNGEVAAFLSGLSTSLREGLGCTVLLVAHSGHGDAQRPRGASSLMSNPDAEYIVTRPDPAGMTVTVSRERFKDAPSLPALAYEARIIDLGRVDRYGEPVTSLALTATDAPAAPKKGRGKNQDKMLFAIKEWHRTRPDAQHISSDDFRAICKAQGLNRQRVREVMESFVAQRILTASIGGYTFHAENL